MGQRARDFLSSGLQMNLIVISIYYDMIPFLQTKSSVRTGKNISNMLEEVYRLTLLLTTLHCNSNIQ